jgi:cell division protein FtsL
MLNNRGSVTMVAFIAMLFFSMYSIIIFSNSVRSYIVQGNSIKTISKIYSQDVETEKMKSIYENNLNKNKILLYTAP